MSIQTVTATPKFFKRKLPAEEVMELIAMKSSTQEHVFLFVRELSDSDSPSRIRVTMTRAQARHLAEELMEVAK